MKSHGWNRFLLCLLILIVLMGCGPQPGLASPTSTSLPPTPSPVPPTLAGSVPGRFFVETFDAEPQNWQVTQVNGDPNLFHAMVTGGRWDFLLEGEYIYVYAIYQPETYRAVKLDVRVESRGADRNFTSLICHFDIDKGWYEFDLSNEGAYHILYAQWDKQTRTVHYTPLVEGRSEWIQPGQNENNYTATCKGSNLTLAVNGETVHSLSEDEFGLTNGNVGIGASSFDALPVRLEFDILTISAP